jgi:hypothetical protein
LWIKSGKISNCLLSKTAVLVEQSVEFVHG